MKKSSTLDLSRGLMSEPNLDAYLAQNQSDFSDEDMTGFLNRLYQRIAVSKATLARQAGLPARYVNGLPEGEGASHAWCEVWLDGVWTGIDPTRGRWTDEGYIRFGVGRDFGDCPMERGVFLGHTSQRQTVFMTVSQQ